MNLWVLEKIVGEKPGVVVADQDEESVVERLLYYLKELVGGFGPELLGKPHEENLEILLKG